MYHFLERPNQLGFGFVIRVKIIYFRKIPIMKKLLLLLLLNGLFLGYGQSQNTTQDLTDFEVGIHFLNNSSTLEAEPVGGTAPYTYLWSNGETSQNIDNVTASTDYCVTVTDSEGKLSIRCTNSSYSEYCQTKFALINNTLYPVISGTPPFSYLWYVDGEEVGTTETIPFETGKEFCLKTTNPLNCHSQKCIGTCQTKLVKIDDNTLVHVQVNSLQPVVARWLSNGEVIGNTDTLNVDLSSYEACGIVAIDTFASLCNFNPIYYGGGFSSGLDIDTVQHTIVAQEHGGIPPYTYLWSDGTTMKSISYLPQSEYCVTITDATGATTTSCKVNNMYIGNLSFSEQVQIDNFLLNHPNITTIHGDVTIFNWQNVPKITNVNGLANITKITGRLYIGKIGNLSGFSNLEHVGALTLRFLPQSNLNSFSSLTTVQSQLRISNNEFLTSLNGLHHLTHVEKLIITQNSKLKNLTALWALTSIRTIRITNNPKLSSLLGLNNLSTISCGLYIEHNELLSSCELCNLTDFTVNFVVADNAIGCTSLEDIACGNIISGTVYYDFNQNQQKDANDYGVPNQKIWVSNPGYYVFTDDLGKYYQYSTTGTYNIAWEPNPDWQLTTNPSEYTINFINGNSSLHNDFGIYPTSEKHSLTSTITSSLIRCNEDASFFMAVTNDGTYKETGHVSLNYTPNISLVAAYPPPTNINTTNHTMSWNYDNLYPFQTEKFHIVFHIPMTQPVTLIDTVYRDSLSTDVVANKSSYSSLITCAYDPNDKQVNPIGINNEHFTQKNQNLTYTVRFQNTGTSYAKDVIIRDTLDPNLDWSSFRLRDFSHKVQTSISTDGLLTFTFKNIYLVDSIEDFESSQGFVTYTISPKENLSENTVISNTAYIYFDFNPAILTNTTINTLVSLLPVTTKSIPDPLSFVLYPNPTSNKFNILIDKSTINRVLVMETIDLAGKVISHQPIKNQSARTFSVDHLQKGMYFISLKDQKTGAILHTEKLVIN